MGVSHGASRPTAPHPDVVGGSSWHRPGSTLAQFAGPEYHLYTRHEYAERSASFAHLVHTPLWEEELVSHKESRSGDYDFDLGGGGPSHDESSQVSVGAS